MSLTPDHTLNLDRLVEDLLNMKVTDEDFNGIMTAAAPPATWSRVEADDVNPYKHTIVKATESQEDGDGHVSHGDYQFDTIHEGAYCWTVPTSDVKVSDEAFLSLMMSARDDIGVH